MWKSIDLMRSAILWGTLFCCLYNHQATRADFSFGEPTRVPNVNSVHSDGSPQISRDGLELYFNYGAVQGTCSYDIWVSRRSTVDDPWSVPVKLDAPVNTPGPQRTPSLSADGLELYFSDGYANVTGCPVNPGGLGHSDLWVSKRSSRDAPWGAPENLGSTVNSHFAEDTPCVSADGLELYFMHDPGGSENSQIYVTTRLSRDDPWTEPVSVGHGVNSNQYEYTPYIASNGLSLFFSRGFSKAHIWVSRRAAISDPWEPAEIFMPLNSGGAGDVWGNSPEGAEFCVSYSEQDSMIYFTRGTTVFSWDYDIWQVEVTPVLDLNGDQGVNKMDLYFLQERLGNTGDTVCDIAPIPFGDGVVDEKDLQVLREELSYEQAVDPSPSNQADNVISNAILRWRAGEFAETHDVYFGADPEAVLHATPDDSMYRGRQQANEYDPGRLGFNQTYYWRVDEVNGAPDFTVFKGDLWSFTVEPASFVVPNAMIVTSSSSGSPPQDSGRVVDGSGLNGSEEHSVGTDDMWLSGPADLEPWIQFAFSLPEKLDKLHVWNHNSQTEKMLGFGFKEALITYSLDGDSWSEWGTVELAQASGTSGYTGEEIELDGMEAKYVKIIGLSNWSILGLPQRGLSEIRFYAIPTRARMESPASGSAGLDPLVNLRWRAGREAKEHEVFIGTHPDALTLMARVDESHYAVSADLNSSVYWRINEVNEAADPAVWEGDLWSFDTAAYVSVDEMEGYRSQDGAWIWETWTDGFENPANGAMLGHFGDDMETDVFHPDSPGQSLPYYYGRGGAAVSETIRNIERDWGQHGITSLSLMFRGDPFNLPGQLYIKVNGVTIATHPNPEKLSLSQWQEWSFDLHASIGQVHTLTLGIEGGAGLVYIDAIRLY